ncbi:MAG: hypothetical protein ACK5LX_05115 [Oscillospiraceae bacterium]
MKKILSILLVLLMVVAIVPLSASAADPTTTDLGLDGIYEVQNAHFPSSIMTDQDDFTDCAISVYSNVITIRFKYLGQQYEYLGEFDPSAEYGYQFNPQGFNGWISLSFYDSPTEEFTFLGFEISDFFGPNLWLDGEISLTRPDNPTEPANYFTPFTGTATSSTAQYELAIAGCIDMELLPGDNVLTLAEIQSNTIAVVAYNNNNGVKRTMNQTTIEEMTVTVSGGQITQIYIMGRVQTSPGTLDRYSTTISL